MFFNTCKCVPPSVCVSLLISIGKKNKKWRIYTVIILCHYEWPEELWGCLLILWMVESSFNMLHCNCSRDVLQLCTKSCVKLAHTHTHTHTHTHSHTHIHTHTHTLTHTLIHVHTHAHITTQVFKEDSTNSHSVGGDSGIEGEERCGH